MILIFVGTNWTLTILKTYLIRFSGSRWILFELTEDCYWADRKIYLSSTRNLILPIHSFRLSLNFYQSMWGLRMRWEQTVCGNETIILISPIVVCQLSIFLSPCLSACLSIRQDVCLPVDVSTDLSIIDVSINIIICLAICLYLAVSQFGYLSVCLFS